MRAGTEGMEYINKMMAKFGAKHDLHIGLYGDDNQKRMTGHHETCRYDEFKAGVSDRTASIRIPANVNASGCGYFEDRRPNANACPYQVAEVLLKSVCDLH